jgi:hypothetical protein
LLDSHDNLPEFHVPDLELVEYENCRTIPKHQMSSAKDVVQLAEMDKSGFFLIEFFLSNFDVLIEHIKKTAVFVEKFNSKSQEIFGAKYSGRADFSQHKFIEKPKIELLRGLLTGERLQKFWKAII